MEWCRMSEIAEVFLNSEEPMIEKDAKFEFNLWIKAILINIIINFEESLIYALNTKTTAVS